uniref:Ubiquitin-like protease family profile domain-containing protein n=1 Tax=Ciona savignyi TaxID=51511 RepID=H2YMN9_CIOSA
MATTSSSFNRAKALQKISPRRALHINDDKSSDFQFTENSNFTAKLKARKNRKKRFDNISPIKDKSPNGAIEVRNLLNSVREETLTSDVSTHRNAGTSKISDPVSSEMSYLNIKSSTGTPILIHDNSDSEEINVADCNVPETVEEKSNATNLVSDSETELNCEETTHEISNDDDDVIVVSQMDKSSSLTYWDIKRIVKNIVLNTMMSPEDETSITDLSPLLLARRMKSLYHKDFSNRLDEISECLERAKSKCLESHHKLTQVRPGLRQHDLDTLKPGEWLNDVIINRYIEMVVNYFDKECCHVSSFFLEELQRGKDSSLPHNWHLKKWLLIPLCLESHWSLLSVNVPERNITVYSSLKTTSAEIDCTNSLLFYLQTCYSNATGDESTWAIKLLKDMPVQENDFDCGVYVCMFARRVVFNLTLRIEPIHVCEYRSWLLSELTDGVLYK